MPHAGRSVQELWNEGTRSVTALQHAALEETGGLDFLGGLSPESQQEAVDMGLAGAGVDEGGDGFDLDEFLAGLLDDEEGGRAESITETGVVTVRTRAEQERTREERRTTDELITRISREYIDVETPEEFLDDFSTAFAGFAANAVEAGMSQADVSAMLDPGSGFMQSMLNEYMGELAQRSARGEDIWRVVGVEGEPEFVGERPGEVTTTEITRMTTTEAEEVLRSRGEEITSESIQSIIDEDFQQRQRDITTTTEQETVAGEVTTTEETGETRFEETEQIFRRPRAAAVLAFSPGEFLLGRFVPGEGGDPETVKERFLGRLATEVRASAPKHRPRETSVAISARRA